MRVEITLQHQHPGIFTPASAVISGHINFSFTANILCTMAIKRERIAKVLMLQHQVHQKELQAIVCTFITQYAHLTGFLDSLSCQWSRLLIPFKSDIVRFRFESISP